MATKKSSTGSIKITFGRRKGGRPKKSYNKHNSKSTYHKRCGSRQK